MCYASPDEATKAVSEMNAKMIGTKPLYVALAQRKDVRRQALESQMAQRANQRLPYGNPSMAAAPQAFMGQPMYGYPQMPSYGQPGMMGMRGGPMMGYPPNPQMMQSRPRYPTAGQPMPGMPMPYGMPPSQMQYMGGMPPNYPMRSAVPNGMSSMPSGPGYSTRPPPASAPRVNGGPSPVGLTSVLPAGAMPRGAMPSRPGVPQYYEPEPPRLNARTLAGASEEQQKQMLGEALYPLIQE